MNFQQEQRQQILNLNNKGVRCLQNGDLESAITILADALQAVKQCDAASSAQGQTLQHQHFPQHMNLEQWFTNIISTKASSQCQNGSDDQQDEECFQIDLSTAGYVYRYPIELPTSTTSDLEASLSPQVQCLTVLFNLAVGFHMKGLHYDSCDSQEEQDWAIDNAITVYELLHDIMASQSINPGLLFMACLANNLGQAHTMLELYDKAQSCFEYLLSIQTYLTDNMPGMTTSSGNSNNNNDGNKTRSRTQDQHHTMAPWEGFLYNTTSLVLSDCCAGAA